MCELEVVEKEKENNWGWRLDGGEVDDEFRVCAGVSVGCVWWSLVLGWCVKMDRKTVWLCRRVLSPEGSESGSGAA